MRTTGIVRRVDDLGRIVIPKEFRRAYDINIGDPIEISADESGSITLKRVGYFSEFKRLCEGTADYLAEQFGWTVLVCDKHRYVAGSGKGKSAFIDGETPSAVLSVVSDGRAKFISVGEVGGGVGSDFSYGYIQPVSDHRGVLGALVVLSDEVISDEQIKVLALSSRLVSNNMQKY